MQLPPPRESVRCLVVAVTASLTTMLWQPRLQAPSTVLASGSQQEIIIVDESGRPCIRLRGQDGKGTIAFLRGGGSEIAMMLGQGLPSALGDESASDACGVIAQPTPTRAGFALLSAPDFGALGLFGKVADETEAFTATLEDGAVGMTLFASGEAGGSTLDLRAATTAAEIDLHSRGRTAGIRVNPQASLFDAEFSLADGSHSMVLGCDEYGAGLSFVERMASELRKRRITTAE